MMSKIPLKLAYAFSISIFALILLGTISLEAWSAAPTFWESSAALIEIGEPDKSCQAQASFTAGPLYSGSGIFNFRVPWELKLNNISNAISAHIHSGKIGHNGPIVLTLFNYSVQRNNTIENGEITPHLLQGPLKGDNFTSFTSFMKLIRQGAYIDIHTLENPEGELRGQLGQKGNSHEYTNLATYSPHRLKYPDAGLDREVKAGEKVILGSSHNTSDNNQIGYEWRQLDGICVNLAGKFTATPSFTAPMVQNKTLLTFGLVNGLVGKGLSGQPSTTDETRVFVIPSTSTN